jgi:PAN domain
MKIAAMRSCWIRSPYEGLAEYNDPVYLLKHRCRSAPPRSAGLARAGRAALAAAVATVLSIFAAAAALAVEPTMEMDTDRFGGDFAWFDLPRPWPQLCQEACLHDETCRAWTYVKPNVRGPLASCWLKSEVGAASHNACCVSGTR